MKGIKIGVDFGSYSLKMCTENNINVVDEFSAIATSVESGVPIAFGKNADNLDGRTDDDINVTRVITNGVVSEFTFAEKLLKYYHK